MSALRRLVHLTKLVGHLTKLVGHLKKLVSHLTRYTVGHVEKKPQKSYNLLNLFLTGVS